MGRTEFGKVVSVRLAFDGRRTIGMLQVKSVMDFVQLAGLEQLGADNVFERTKKGIAHWARFLMEACVTHLRDTSLLTSRSALLPPLAANARYSSRALK